MLYIRNKIIWKRKVENKATVKEGEGKCKSEGSRTHTQKGLAILITFEVEFKMKSKLW